MPQQFVYNGTDLGVSAIRLGKIPGWIGEAEEGAVGICGVPIDDPTGTLTITGWQSFIVNELAAPIGNQRVWTGFVNDRNYHRGDSDSLRTGAARQIDVNLVDLNAIFSLRLFPQSDTTANRPSETDVARLEWLLSTSYLTTSAYGAVADHGLLSTSGPVTLDAADYRGQSAMSLISDCMQASGKNCFPRFKESVGGLEIFYDFDYSAVFDSTLTLSNVLSDINNTTCFMYEEDANLNRDPSLVYSGVQVPFSGTGSPVYRTNPTTAAAFISRDTTAPNVNVKTSTAANALGDRYLASIASEDDLLTLTVKIPAAKVTLIQEGMRIQVKASHLPDLTSFTYCRILSREAKQQEETPDYYQLVLKLAPPTPVIPLGDGILSWNSDDLTTGGTDGSVNQPYYWFNSTAATGGFSSDFYEANHAPYDFTIPAADLVHGDNVLAAYIENAVFAPDWAHNPTMFHWRFIGGDGTVIYSPGATVGKILPLKYWNGSSYTTLNSIPANWQTAAFDDSGWGNSVNITASWQWGANDLWPTAYYMTPYGAVDTNLNGLNWLVRCHFTLP